MLDRQVVLDEAQKKIDLAYLTTPPEYHGFITLVSQNKRLNPEDRAAKPLYVRVENPYIRVDGRVAMARDEHKELGKRLDIMKPVFETLFDTPVCHVTVFSEVYGTSTGTAKVSLGGRGVDETNPLENAQTSAVGRALGFMGYGLLGGGIASAEEVEQAIKEQAPATKSTKVAEADAYDLPAKRESEGGPAETPASEKQMQFLRALLSQNGTLKGDSLPVIQAVYEHELLSKSRVSADIEELRESEKLTPKYLAAYLKILRENAKLSHNDIYEYIKKHFNVGKIKDLTREQQDQLIGWLTIGNEDKPDDFGKAMTYAASAIEGDIDMAELWARHAFVEYSEGEIAYRVLSMDFADIKKDIRSYQEFMNQQMSMEGVS